MILSVGLATLSYAAADMDVLKIEGDYYVVKDIAGKEMRMHVDKTTGAGRLLQGRRPDRGPHHGKGPRIVH